MLWNQRWERETKEIEELETSIASDILFVVNTYIIYIYFYWLIRNKQNRITWFGLLSTNKQSDKL